MEVPTAQSSALEVSNPRNIGICIRDQYRPTHRGLYCDRALHHIVVIREDMFDLAPLFEENFGNTGRKAIAFSHTAKHGRQIANRRFVGMFEKLPATVKISKTTYCHHESPFTV
jgi:hypothetical protein